MNDETKVYELIRILKRDCCDSDAPICAGCDRNEARECWRDTAIDICQLFDADKKYNLTDPDQPGKIIHITLDTDNRITSWRQEE